MSVVLVIMTFYLPNVQLSLQELPSRSQQHCEERIVAFEAAWADQPEEFGYTLRCELRERAEENDT